MGDASREEALRDLDRRDWRRLWDALALLAAVALVVLLMENDLLPAFVALPMLLASLGAFWFLDFKAIDAQAARGRLDPMSRGERVSLAAVLVIAVLGLLAASAGLLPGRMELPFYVGLVLSMLGAVAVIDRRHKRRRRA